MPFAIPKKSRFPLMRTLNSSVYQVAKCKNRIFQDTEVTQDE